MLCAWQARLVGLPLNRESWRDQILFSRLPDIANVVPAGHRPEGKPLRWFYPGDWTFAPHPVPDRKWITVNSILPRIRDRRQIEWGLHHKTFIRHIGMLRP